MQSIQYPFFRLWQTNRFVLCWYNLILFFCGKPTKRPSRPFPLCTASPTRRGPCSRIYKHVQSVTFVSPESIFELPICCRLIWRRSPLVLKVTLISTAGTSSASVSVFHLGDSGCWGKIWGFFKKIFLHYRFLPPVSDVKLVLSNIQIGPTLLSLFILGIPGHNILHHLY